MYKKLIYFFILISVVAGCKSVHQGLFTKQTPHEEYMSKIINAGLNNNKVGQAWMTAAEERLFDPVKIEIPFSEALVLDFEHLTAASYSLFLREGQNLHVMAEPEGYDTSQIFIDLFRLDNNEYKHIAHAEQDSIRLDYRIKRDGQYLVRIQPELLTKGLFAVYIFTDSSLNFPVPNKDFNSISSFFGDPRDGGRRRHEGVDVFAPRGTPALAVGPGRVSLTGTNRLGGKVVWVTDTQKGYNYYYAHLDSQLVRPGMRVNAGDTIGMIGNTGNAATTPPHLHFGIYAFGRRSIDPYVFFHRTEMPSIDSVHINQLAGKWALTTAPRTNFRSAPGMDADINSSLSASTPLKIRGITGNWVRVELPEGDRGYIYRSLVTPAVKPKQETIPAGKVIRSRPSHDSPAQGIIQEDTKVNIYAEFNTYLLIEAADNFGWVDTVS